jgi:hypothetical protein
VIGVGMAKKYVFRFKGTKEMFLNRFQWSNDISDDKERCKYINEYIIKLIGDKIHFGVDRGGHSGGYWYVPEITEFDDYIELRGKIKYESDETNALIRFCDKLAEVILYILFLPIIGIIELYTLIRKLCNKPVPKAQSTEDKLFDLMINHLNCTLI